jgi:hypothetical protein
MWVSELFHADGWIDRQTRQSWQSLFTVLQMCPKLEQMKVNEKEEGTAKKEKEDVKYIK